jgi:hypothetical protein
MRHALACRATFSIQHDAMHVGQRPQAFGQRLIARPHNYHTALIPQVELRSYTKEMLPSQIRAHFTNMELG